MSLHRLDVGRGEGGDFSTAQLLRPFCRRGVEWGVGVLMEGPSFERDKADCEQTVASIGVKRRRSTLTTVIFLL